MRRSLIASAALLALTAAGLPNGLAPAVATSDLANAAPGPGGFTSSNIEYVATLLSDSPGVGGNIHVMPNGERRLYVSSVQGLRIYNIDSPALPLLIGAFEIANWENEDVSVSKDGKTVLMSEFTGTGYTYVFQVSDPLTPAGTVAITLGDYLILDASHIVDCIDDACNYFYGAEGQTWDATDKTNVKRVTPGWGDIMKAQVAGFSAGSGHNIQVVGDYDLDGDGDLERVAVSDTTPMVMMDVTNPAIPLYVSSSSKGDHSANRTAYQHNNKIPDFEAHVPRDVDDKWDIDTNPDLRDGELVLGNGETNFGPSCSAGSGPLTSWSAAGWDKTKQTGDQWTVLNTFRPINGMYDGTDADGGNPRVNAIGCSGHWFDVRHDDADSEDYIVAAAWYEHGTRVIRVDGQSGEFEQLGFFQPVVGSASAAHWVVDEEDGIFIFTIDYVRGVDILKYNPEAPIESEDTFTASWFMESESSRVLSEQARYNCSLKLQTAKNGGFVPLTPAELQALYM